MHLAVTNGGVKCCLEILTVGRKFGSTKLAAAAPGSPDGAGFAGWGGMRGALTLAVFSALLLIAARPAQAQTETVLYSFTGGSDGGYYVSSPISDNKGNFYGTTAYGGANGQGTVFELSPNGNAGDATLKLGEM